MTERLGDVAIVTGASGVIAGYQTIYLMGHDYGDSPRMFLPQSIQKWFSGCD